jgi:hypothetical protein
MMTIEMNDIPVEAFNALPEPYQADSCLEFFKDKDGFLWTQPKPEEVPYLGRWKAVFDHQQSKRWLPADI